MLKLLQENTICNFLQNQKILAELNEQAVAIALWALFFTVLSWGIYYLMAPNFMKSNNPRARSLSANGIGAKKSENHTRLKWGHMTVSFIHALVVVIWSAYNLFNDTELYKSVDSRVNGFSASFALMFSFSIGYFIWDVFCNARYLSMYGYGFFIHALLGVIGLTCCLRPFMIYHTTYFLFFEVSTIFLNLHWFLEKFGYAGSKTIVVNDIFGLAAYLFIRLAYGSYLSYASLYDLYLSYQQIPYFFSFIFILANVTTHSLNFFWFYKLCRSLSKTVGGKAKKA